MKGVWCELLCGNSGEEETQRGGRRQRQMWRKDRLNIHPSLLPKYKGLHTHARALQAGDGEHGCSVHGVTAALDDGPILGQARIAVLPADTPVSLAMRLLPCEHELYPAVLRRFAAQDRRAVHLPITRSIP